jgi:hypothetical protein
MQTKRSYLGKPFIMKRLHKMLVAGHPGDAVGSTVDTTVESVGYDMASFPDVSFAGRGMKWGDEWGSPWAVQDLRAVELKPKLKGDRFQVTFTNAKAGESVVLYSLVMQYRAERKLKGVRYNG